MQLSGASEAGESEDDAIAAAAYHAADWMRHWKRAEDGKLGRSATADARADESRAEKEQRWQTS